MTARTLTLLFTDIVGSTARFSGIRDHAANQLRRRHFEALREQIERHDGTQVKTLGDGVMATFSAAEAAIESAVAMQLVIAQHESGPPGRPMPLRVGLSSGDIRQEEGDCFGAAVVTASRLCDRAAGGQILLAESTRLLANSSGPLRKVGDFALKGLPETTATWEILWSHRAKLPLRVVLADDAVLVREGIARVLEEQGIEVVAQACDSEQLCERIGALRPDLAIVDVRMPPTHTDEGVVAAEAILTRYPGTGVLILSNDFEPHYAERLLRARSNGVGYLLKERVADVRSFHDAARRVAAGETVFEKSLDPTAGSR